MATVLYLVSDKATSPFTTFSYSGYAVCTSSSGDAHTCRRCQQRKRQAVLYIHVRNNRKNHFSSFFLITLNIAVTEQTEDLIQFLDCVFHSLRFQQCIRAERTERKLRRNTCDIKFIHPSISLSRQTST